MHHFSTKIILTSLLFIVTCTVYNVIPDDDHNTTCYHCHTMQYYQLNISKYFSSNTQILFLSGLHHLQTDLVIQNIHNISLLGYGNSVIKCTKLARILIINVTGMTANNLKIHRNISSFNINSDLLYSSVIIRDCKNVLVVHLIIDMIYDNQFKFYSLMVINVLGESQLRHILCHNIRLHYSETEMEKKNNLLLIDDYHTQNEYLLVYYNIMLTVDQIYYRLMVQLSNTSVEYYINSFISIKCNENTKIFALVIINCQFKFNYFELFNGHVYNGKGNNDVVVYFKSCQFVNNNYSTSYITIHGITIVITDCFFDDIRMVSYQSYNNTTIFNMTNTVITNTNYKCKFQRDTLIRLKNTIITLSETVIFTNIHCYDTVISLKGLSTITIDGLVKFSNCHANEIINLEYNNYQFIMIKNFITIKVAQNKVCTFFHTVTFKPISYPFCFFQYFTNERHYEGTYEKVFSIIFDYNKCNTTIPYCVISIPITNCQWLPHSIFRDVFPLDINEQYIKYTDDKNSSMDIATLGIEQSTLCVCSNETSYNCHINDLGYLYPGETLTICLHSLDGQRNSSDISVVVVKTDISLPNIKPCTVLDVSEYQQFIVKSCNKVSYTIAFSSYQWCEIYLKLLSDTDEKINMFTVKKLNCPPGFAETNNICQCDPVLASFKITSCNINNQTILRPANSWVSAATHNNSYTYHITLQCPFHYCLPHSSHLSFSTPNSQCHFKRSGLLCGQCQHGLSSVFSSSYCQKCSNIYILLIIPIGLAGLLLVFLIFHLNLTVTDGNINAFILYTNIISINTTVFFLSTNQFMPAYTFISLANLDLGIQTCFFNGMDDYAKMWLQLAFPCYLIFIATMLIITSRYSTRIQRLTARRALPVLATHFLLSYTKVLSTVSSVLFYYTSLTHLPSKRATVVWSMDANIPLFGFQFIILFIVCLILFLFLVVFNIILLFTRTLSRFRYINKFKPLLDAYQGPYKNKFYYWTGLQLLLRAVLFGLSSLDRNVNLMVGIILLDIYGGITGLVQPFNNKMKNYQEMVLLFNLHGLYAIALYTQDGTNMTVVNVMIIISAIQFAIIIIYHIITYACSRVIVNKIHLCVIAITHWITTSHKRSQCHHFQLQGNIRDSIPEVAFNYCESREPLICQD